MKYIGLFLEYIIFYYVFDSIIHKTDIHNTLFNKPRVRKHIKIILVIFLFVFVFFIEYFKGMLRDVYGFESFITLMSGAFLTAVYTNFIPVIFKNNKSKYRLSDIKI